MVTYLQETEKIVEAARLYYEHNLSQQQIAKKLNVSRPGVSRLLKEARRKGIVQIQILDPQVLGTRLEANLKEKFGLKKAIVVPNDDENSTIIKSRLGKAAMLYLDSLVHENMVLGVSWGTTMQEVANRIPKRNIKNMTVVQLNGGISKAEYDTHASEIAQKIGERYRATPYLLPLPAIVDSYELKKAIIADSNIARTLDLGKKASVCIFTVGEYHFNSVLVKADYFKREEVEDLLAAGAVGDVCSRIINKQGKMCSKELDSRTIGLELADLQKKEYAIAVAGGKEKFEAISAALKGKLFNVLITDEGVAKNLLDEENNK